MSLFEFKLKLATLACHFAIGEGGYQTVRTKALELEIAMDRALGSTEGMFVFRKDRKRQLLIDLGKVLLGVLMILIAWFLVAELVITLKGIAFPRPLDAFVRLGELLGGQALYGESIYAHIGASLYRWVAGYVLAVVVGLLLGISLGVSTKGHDVGIVPIHILQMVPGLAWVPIAMLIFGLGNVATMFMIFMTALPPIAISTSSGIRGVEPNMLKAAEMTGSTRPRIFFKILLPASALSVINGLRIGLANGWRVLIAAEMVVGIALGLGYSIFQSRWSLDFEAAFVCIIIICVIGLTIEKLLFVALEDRVRERMGLRGADR
jgi:ABC-type nitrate/sulfonate/bicarbonate transport system permease component